MKLPDNIPLFEMFARKVYRELKDTEFSKFHLLIAFAFYLQCIEHKKDSVVKWQLDKFGEVNEPNEIGAKIFYATLADECIGKLTEGIPDENREIERKLNAILQQIENEIETTMTHNIHYGKVTSKQIHLTAALFQKLENGTKHKPSLRKAIEILEVEEFIDDNNFYSLYQSYRKTISKNPN